MATWFWLALASNIVVWSIFFVLLARGRWNWVALTVGVLHMPGKRRITNRWTRGSIARFSTSFVDSNGAW